VLAAPAASRANEKCTRASHHRYAETVRHSLRDGATTYFVLSPVTGLFCHRRLADHPAKLDASVGASGPHDFAVRRSFARLATLPRPPHPAPNVRDDGQRPSLGRDGGSCRSDLPDGLSEIFLQMGLDSKSPTAADLPVGQISLRANQSWLRSLRCRRQVPRTDRTSCCHAKTRASLITPGPEPAERWMLSWEQAAAPLARSVPVAAAWPACSAQAVIQQELGWPPPALRLCVARARSLIA